MSLKATFNAIPRFWKIYIVCILLAMTRMGNPDWEWSSPEWQSWTLAMKSAQESLIRDIKIIAASPPFTLR